MYIDKKKCIDIKKNQRLFPLFNKKSPRLGNGTKEREMELNRNVKDWIV